MNGYESLKSNMNFQNVYKNGVSYANKYLVMYVLENRTDNLRLGISVSKKVGNSIVRHRLTRLIRESVRLNSGSILKGYDIVIIARANLKGKNYADTGFTPYDDPEPIAKVVIDKKKLSKTTVKFVYNIIIMNQGEIPGYATEITDYIPEGLEFVAEDNPLWTKETGNKITTRALEGKLLNPGDSATVEVIFTWKNGEENLGLKTNIAEISEDYNDKGSKDIAYQMYLILKDCVEVSNWRIKP